MNDQYTTNIYGYWQYNYHRGLYYRIVKYDLIYVFKVKDGTVHALNEKGRVISFHKRNITNNHFDRPSYENHKKCELGIRSSRFYRTLETSEHHKNDCHKCQMYKFKQTVKRWKLRNK